MHELTGGICQKYLPVSKFLHPKNDPQFSGDNPASCLSFTINPPFFIAQCSDTSGFHCSQNRYFSVHSVARSLCDVILL